MHPSKQHLIINSQSTCYKNSQICLVNLSIYNPLGTLQTPSFLPVFVSRYSQIRFHSTYNPRISNRFKIINNVDVIENTSPTWRLAFDLKNTKWMNVWINMYIKDTQTCKYKIKLKEDDPVIDVAKSCGLWPPGQTIWCCLFKAVLSFVALNRWNPSKVGELQKDMYFRGVPQDPKFIK